MVEYALLIGVVCTSLILTALYIKRANLGRLKKDSDSLGVQFSPTYSNRGTVKNYYYETTSVTHFNGEGRIDLTVPDLRVSSYNDDFSGRSLKQEGVWE